MDFRIKIYFILLVILTNQISFAKQCEVTHSKDKTASITIGRHNISVIGWTHLGHTEHKDLSETVDKIHDLANKGQCKKAAELSDALFNRRVDELRNAQIVLVSLKNLYKTKSFSKIGVEYSFVEQLNYDKKEKWTAKFNAISANCPEVETNFIRLGLQGPEKEFARQSNGKVEVEGVDSDLLRNKSLKKMSEEAMYFFGGGDGASKLSPAAFDSVLKIMEIDDPNNFPDSMIVSAVNSEPDPILKQKLDKALRELKSVMMLASRRNSIIAQNIINRKDDYTLVIGAAHFEGVLQELVSRCKKIIERESVNTNNEVMVE